MYTHNYEYQCVTHTQCEKKMKNKTHHYDFPSSQNGTFGGRKKERKRERESVRGSRKSTPFGLLI